jgi:hypothetical protein
LGSSCSFPRSRYALRPPTDDDDDRRPDDDPGGSGEIVYHFTGFTYSAACTEVEIDVLTEETTVLRADVIYELALIEEWPPLREGALEVRYRERR